VAGDGVGVADGEPDGVVAPGSGVVMAGEGDALLGEGLLSLPGVLQAASPRTRTVAAAPRGRVRGFRNFLCVLMSSTLVPSRLSWGNKKAESTGPGWISYI